MSHEDNAASRAALDLAPHTGLAPLLGTPERLASLEEVPLLVEVRLGRASLTLVELIKMRAGAVLGLDRQVGEAAEIIVGGKVVGHGQLVAIGNELGLRVTELARGD